MNQEETMKNQKGQPQFIFYVLPSDMQSMFECSNNTASAIADSKVATTGSMYDWVRCVNAKNLQNRKINFGKNYIVYKFTKMINMKIYKLHHIKIFCNTSCKMKQVAQKCMQNINYN